MELFQQYSKVNDPIKFLVFLDRISHLKANIGENPDNGSLSDWVSLKGSVQQMDLSTEHEVHFIPSLQDPLLDENNCLWKFACDNSFILKKSFKFNFLNDELLETVNLGNGREANSIIGAAQILWDREFPSKPTSESGFIPEKLLENYQDIPLNFKATICIIKQIFSICETFFKAQDQGQGVSTMCLNRLQENMKIIQTALDVWVFSPEEVSNRTSLWTEEDWLETAFASLTNQVPNSGQNQPNPKLQEFLDEIYPNQLKPIRILGTFLLEQLLDFNGHQMESLVERHAIFGAENFKRNVFEALFAWQSHHPKWTTVFFGLELFGNTCNEFDFLIILGQVKKILYVNCNHNLTKDMIEKVKKQADKIFNFLQKKLPLKRGWEFESLLCYETCETFVTCKTCRPFLVRVSGLESALNQIMMGKLKQDMEQPEAVEDYELLIKIYLFYALQNRPIFDDEQAANHQLEVGNWSKEKLFLWTLPQLWVLQNDPQRMLLKSNGKHGTGTTEIFKIKVAKLAEDPGNKIAFLVGVPGLGRHEQLLTKVLRFHFQRGKIDNVKVGEISPRQNISKILRNLFPNCTDRSQIHVFMDEASQGHNPVIEEFIAQHHVNSKSVIWIVDKDNSIDLSLEHGFVREDRLMTNLRNSEDVERIISLANHGERQFLKSSEEMRDEALTDAIQRAFLEEPSVKKVLFLVGKSSWKKIKIGFKQKHGIQFYGSFKPSKNCSDEELEHFFKPSNQLRQILMAPEDLACGIESDTILVWDVNDIEITTQHRAKTKLITAFMIQQTHQLIEEQKPMPLLKPDFSQVFGLNILNNRKLINYALMSKKLPSERGTRVQYYWNYQKFMTKHGDCLAQYGPIKAIEQYHMIQTQSPNSTISNYPLLFWVQFENEKVTFCIGLKGQSLKEVNPSALGLSHPENVPVREVFLAKMVPVFARWKGVLIAEIIWRKAMEIPWDRWFVLKRLFSIWLRLYEEKQQSYQLDHSQMTFPSKKIRMQLLRNFLRDGNHLGDLLSILPTFAPNHEIYNWDLIQTLLAWWHPNYGDTLANHLIRLENLNQPYKSPSKVGEPSKQELCYWDIFPHLKDVRTVFTPRVLLEPKKDPKYPFEEEYMTDLSEQIRFWFGCTKERTWSKRLHFPWVWWTWMEQMVLVWLQVLGENFPHVQIEPWYGQLLKWQKAIQVEMEAIQKQRGSNSIFLLGENERLMTLNHNQCYLKIFNDKDAMMMNIFLFVSKQTRSSKQCS